MATKKKAYATDGETIQTTIRLEQETLRRAEDLVPFVQRDLLLKCDRVKVLRTAISLGLKELERRRAKEGG